MPLFSNCFDFCLATELSSVARKSHGIISPDEKKKSTKKHSQKKNKCEHKDHKQREKKRESDKYTKSKGENNRSNKNKYNLTHKKKNHHKKETSINQQEYVSKTSLCQNNTINKMKSLTNNKQKEECAVLVDEQWNVCNYQDNKNVLLDKVQIMHTVSIFNCNNSTIVIDAEKFKSLQIQNCIKCNVVLKNLISAIEMIDSKKMKVQITGRCASVTIDKCIGVEIYLSKENEETEFTTALSAEMNVHVEGNNPDDDWKEITIPEQYQHVLNKGDLTTRVSDLYKF